MVLVLGVSLGVSGTLAQETDPFKSSGLKIPRFVTLAKDKVFLRTGPGLRYPIKWVYKRQGLPIEVIQEFDTWRKVRDIEGDEGWVHQALLSGRRNAVVTEEKGALLVRKPVTGARPVALLEPDVVITLEHCSGAWCSGSADGFDGWIERKSLWGVYEDEELD
jgi:SH3-like domain-containing protein